MERERSSSSSSREVFLMLVLLAALVSQNVMTPVMCRRNLEGFGDQKNYYPPNPHQHSHKKPACPTPSDGSSHGTPSHGSGGSYGTPAPSHGGGGAYGPPTPAPSHGGGGYYSPPGGGGGHPSTPIIIPPPNPTTPLVPPTPTTPLVPPTPTLPLVPPTPTLPLVPPTPGTTAPPSPFIPDPNIPPFFIGTCDYWRTHPQVIWGIFGYWATLGGLLGTASTTTPAGSDLSVLDALANPHTDGIGALYREGTASFLNSMVNRKFVFSTQQVKNAFAKALATEKAAAAQALLFKRANEGHLKHH